MMLILAPVSFSKSGARRCSGSAICGPVKVIRLTVTPSKSPAEAGEAGAEARMAAASPAAAAKRLLLVGFIGLLPLDGYAAQGAVGFFSWGAPACRNRG